MRELSKTMQTFLEMLRSFRTRHMMDGPDALEQASPSGSLPHWRRRSTQSILAQRVTRSVVYDLQACSGSRKSLKTKDRIPEYGKLPLGERTAPSPPPRPPAPWDFPTPSCKCPPHPWFRPAWRLTDKAGEVMERARNLGS